LGNKRRKLYFAFERKKILGNPLKRTRRVRQRKQCKFKYLEVHGSGKGAASEGGKSGKNFGGGVKKLGCIEYEREHRNHGPPSLP